MEEEVVRRVECANFAGNGSALVGIVKDIRGRDGLADDGALVVHAAAPAGAVKAAVGIDLLVYAGGMVRSWLIDSM